MDYEDIGNDFFRERNQLLQWSSSVPILDAAFPGLPSDCAMVKFRHASKMSTSKKNNCIAILTPDGELRFVLIKDGMATLKCHLIVQLDPYCEYCFLKWTQSEILLILSQSDGKINIFDYNGGLCYSIINQIFDTSGIITEIRSVSIENDDNFIDFLYVLQLNSQFIALKLGKSNYELMFSVNLELYRSYSFSYLPIFNLIFVSTEYIHTANRINGLNGSDIGINAYRVFNEFPFVDCIKKSNATNTWKKMVKRFMPLYDRTSTIFSIEPNAESTFLVAISNAGDVFVLHIPSLKVCKVIYAEQIGAEMQPIEIKWATNEKISLLHKNGVISHATIDELKFTEDFVLVPYCAAIDWNSAESFITFTEQESSKNNRIVSKNDYVNRFWLFTIFRLSFIYQWIKALGGALVGEPIENVSNSGFERRFLHNLYEIKKITRLRFIEKLLTKKDYDYAIRLALEAENFDMDLIYKKQWIDTRDFANEETIKVLEKVNDKVWVVYECLTCKKENMETQKLLIDVAQSVIYQVEEPLQKKFYRAKIAYESLPTHLTDDVSLYIRFRTLDLLKMICIIAQEGRIELLKHIALRYIYFLHEYMLIILSFIPESISPKIYSSVLPSLSSSTTIVFNTKNADKEILHVELDQSILKEFTSLEKYRLNGNEVVQFEQWCEDRIYDIDHNTGIINYSISLLEIAIENGFDKLNTLLIKMKIFRNFVNFSSTVSLSYDQFLSSEPGYIRESISKHMKEEELQSNIELVIEIFELFHYKAAKNEIFQLIQSYSHLNLNTLIKLVQVKPNFFSETELISIFLQTSLTGNALIEALENFEELSSHSRLLKMFKRLDFLPTFLQVYNSFTSKTLAEQIFRKILVRGVETTNLNWPDLLFQMQDIQAFYAGLLTKHEITALIASEMLFFYGDKNFVDFPTDLIVDFRSNHAYKEWEEIIIQKSQEFIERSMPLKNDSNLLLARSVINLLPDKQRSNSLKEILVNIQVIELSIALGLQRLPATYRFCEPQNLLEEVVAIDKNYKQVKRCAELAKLIGIKVPATKAMVICAKEALKAKDFAIFERYIRQLLKTAKGHIGIYQLCKEALDCKEISYLSQELLTCMILNCPNRLDEELLEVLDSIQILHLKVANQQETSSKLLIDDMFLLDPIYSTLNEMHRISFENTPTIPHELIDSLHRIELSNCDEIIHNYAKKWLTSSVTVALFVDLLAEFPTNSYLLTNNLLRHLLQALKKLQELGTQNKLGNFAQLVPAIEQLPTEVLLKIGNEREKLGVSSIERILDMGIERERFFEDSIYRMDSLFALISMTKDDTLINDVIEVAEQFNFSKWDLLIALLKYLLTDEEVSPIEAKALMKSQKLHETLWANLERLYMILRDSILSQISEKDINKLKLYLTFFKSTEPEYDFLKCLSNIQSTKFDFSLKKLLNGDKLTWLEWIRKAFEENHDDDILAIIRFLKKLPNIEDIAGRFLDYIIKNDFPNNRSIRVLFYLMEKRDDLLIDEISQHMEQAKEIDYWTQIVNEWHSEDKYENRLINKIRRRIDFIKNRAIGSRSISNSPEPSQTKYEMKRRKQ